jgi:hypothetical protein
VCSWCIGFAGRGPSVSLDILGGNGKVSSRHSRREFQAWASGVFGGALVRAGRGGWPIRSGVQKVVKEVM